MAVASLAYLLLRRAPHGGGGRLPQLPPGILDAAYLVLFSISLLLLFNESYVRPLMFLSLIFGTSYKDSLTFAVAIPYNLISLVFVFLVARRLFDEKIGLISAIALVVFPFHILYGYVLKPFTYISRTPIHPDRGEKELPDLIQCAVDDGQLIKIFSICGQYTNINSEDDLQEARRILSRA